MLVARLSVHGQKNTMVNNCGACWLAPQNMIASTESFAIVLARVTKTRFKKRASKNH